MRDRIHTLIRFLTCPMLRVLDAVPPHSTLLDIGAGHGVFATLVNARGAQRVVGVEPDARKVRPIAGIESIIGFDDVVRGTFGAITIIDVLYKIPMNDWDALLLRCRARLASGGLLIIKEQDPTARVKNSWNAAQERVATALQLTLGESFSYESPAAFVARLERLGFRDVRSKRVDFGYPHPHVMYVGRI